MTAKRVVPLDSDQMLFSGLHRYVRISEAVANSKQNLSASDRYWLTRDLLAEFWDPTVAQVEKRCREFALTGALGSSR